MYTNAVKMSKAQQNSKNINHIFFGAQPLNEKPSYYLGHDQDHCHANDI